MRSVLTNTVKTLIMLILNSYNQRNRFSYITSVSKIFHLANSFAAQ